MIVCAEVVTPPKREAEMTELTGFLLDACPVGIIVLDPKGTMIRHNAAAEQMAETDDGIRLTDRGPRLTRPSDDRTLQRIITTALKNRSGGAMAATRPSGKRPYAVQVTPLSSLMRAALWIEIHDPDAKPPLPAAALQDVYSLSQSEAALAQCLAAGDDLKAAADKLGIRYSTARTQLTGIFRKTQTRRQGELIRLLLGLQSPAASWASRCDEE